MTARSALWLTMRVELRRHWLSLIIVGAIAGLVGGVAIATASGIRRSDTAYDRQVSATRFPDALIQTFEPPPGVADFVRSRPEVRSVVETQYAVGAHLGFGEDAYVPVVHGDQLPFEPLIVAGRDVDQTEVGEVMLSEKLAREIGLEVGDTIPWHGLSHRQFASFGEGFQGFEGPRVDLVVVGITKLPSDATLGELPAIFGTAAFHRAHADALPRMHTLWVELADDTALPSVTEALGAHLADEDAPVSDVFGPFFAVSLSESRGSLDDAVRLASIGLLAMTIVVVGAGVFVIGQMVARQLLARTDTDRALMALGFRRSERLGIATLTGLVSVAPALVTATILAVGLSPLFPVGAARDVEPNPGGHLNVALWAVGLAALALVIVGVWTMLGRQVTRSTQVRARRHPAPRTRIGRAGPFGALGLAGWVGTRMAFESGSGRTSVPVRLTLVGTAAGLAGVLGSLGFTASLDALVADPSRWGQPADVVVNLPDDVRDTSMERLLRSDDVEALTLESAASIEIGGFQTTAYALQPRKGDILPTPLSGRLPAGAHEIALGPALLDSIGREVGEEVLLSGPDGQGGDPVTLTIVGTVLTPGSDQDKYTTGAVLTAEGLTRVQVSEGFLAAHVRFRDGVDPMAAGDGLLGRLERSLPTAPVEVDNVAALGHLPELLGVFLALLAIAALGHAVLVAGRRRRPDLAILRCLGFTAGQTRRAVVAMAMATAVAGLLFGAPAGLVLANVSWSWVADQLFVEPRLHFEVATAALPIVVVAGAAAIALVPARLASRPRPGALLRVE